MENNLLLCKICQTYEARQLHQHLKKVHDINAKTYRSMYGANEIMQIGFNPHKIPIDRNHSNYVKRGYEAVLSRISDIEPYSRKELCNVLIKGDLWQAYLGKSKYRRMIKDDARLYKSVMHYTSTYNIKMTLEQRLRLIVLYNFDLDAARCSCKRKVTFGRNCRHCSEHKRLSIQRQVETKVGLRGVNYNKLAILEIEKLAATYGISDVIHAENGGEYRVAGYYLDGYSLLTNTAFEYDEKHHYQPNGCIKLKDLTRQRIIQDRIGCRFIRIKYDGSVAEY